MEFDSARYSNAGNAAQAFAGRKEDHAVDGGGAVPAGAGSGGGDTSSVWRRGFGRARGLERCNLLTERLSNEVASHTRATNQKITDRFARLGHDQIEKLCRWLEEQAPSSKALDQLEKSLGEARDV